MVSRTLYLVRHGAADAMGQLTDVGVKQSELIGSRLAQLPIDAIWHSPLPRATDSAQALMAQLSDVFVDQAAELVDHVPFVPDRQDVSPSWLGFFDGYDSQEATAGRRTADALTNRFARPNDPSKRETHEVLVTHAYPIAWLVRHTLAAPATRWMALAGVANASLTVLEYTDAEPATVVMFNDLSHLPAELSWTGFPSRRP